MKTINLYRRKLLFISIRTIFRCTKNIKLFNFQNIIKTRPAGIEVIIEPTTFRLSGVFSQIMFFYL